MSKGDAPLRRPDPDDVPSIGYGGQAPVWLGLSRNVIVFGVLSLLTDLAAEMIVPLLPLFLKAEFLAGPAVIGLISGVSESLASFLKLGSGWLSDRAGKRKSLIVLGYAVSLVRPLMGIATAWWHVMLVRVADRVGKGVRLAPRDALLADSCGEAVRGRAFGFQQFADNIGAALGPLAALALLAWVTADMRTVFIFSVVPCTLLVVVAALGIVEKPPSKAPEPVRLTLKPFDAPFRVYLVATFLFHIAVAADFFLILRMESAGYSIRRILLLWFALSAVRSLSAMAGGVLSDRVGRRPLIAAGWALFAAAWASFAFVPPAWVVVPLLAFGVFGGLSLGPQRALVADLVPVHLRGTAYGLYACAHGVATLVGNVAFGLAWQHLGVVPAFAGGAALALVGLAVLSVLHRSPGAPAGGSAA